LFVFQAPPVIAIASATIETKSTTDDMEHIMNPFMSPAYLLGHGPHSHQHVHSHLPSHPQPNAASPASSPGGSSGSGSGSAAGSGTGSGSSLKPRRWGSPPINLAGQFINPATGKKRVQCSICFKTFCDKGWAVQKRGFWNGFRFPAPSIGVQRSIDIYNEIYIMNGIY